MEDLAGWLPGLRLVQELPLGVVVPWPGPQDSGAVLVGAELNKGQHGRLYEGWERGAGGGGWPYRQNPS